VRDGFVVGFEVGDVGRDEGAVDVGSRALSGL